MKEKPMTRRTIRLPDSIYEDAMRIGPETYLGNGHALIRETIMEYLPIMAERARKKNRTRR